MPDISVVHIDQALTEVSLAYRNLQYVADAIFPPMSVSKQSNKYFVYGKERVRTLDDSRRPGARANEVEWTLSTDTYYCEGHALAQAIPDELRANADQGIDIDVDTTEMLTDLVLLQREIAAAGKALDSGVVTNHLSAAAWDNSQSEVLKQLDTARESILKKTFRLPNGLLLSFPVFLALRRHPSILARVQFVQRSMPEDISAALLASGLGLDRVVIGSAIKNVNEGTADDYSYVWGKNAVLFHDDPNGRKIVPFGRQFNLITGGGSNVMVKRYRDEARTADVVEVQNYYDLKVVASDAAYLFDDCIS